MLKKYYSLLVIGLLSTFIIGCRKDNEVKFKETLLSIDVSGVKAMLAMHAGYWIDLGEEGYVPHRLYQLNTDNTFAETNFLFKEDGISEPFYSDYQVFPFSDNYFLINIYPNTSYIINKATGEAKQIRSVFPHDFWVNEKFNLELNDSIFYYSDDYSRLVKVQNIFDTSSASEYLTPEYGMNKFLVNAEGTVVYDNWNPDEVVALSTTGEQDIISGKLMQSMWKGNDGCIYLLLNLTEVYQVCSDKFNYIGSFNAVDWGDEQFSGGIFKFPESNKVIGVANHIYDLSDPAHIVSKMSIQNMNIHYGDKHVSAYKYNDYLYLVSSVDSSGISSFPGIKPRISKIDPATFQYEQFDFDAYSNLGSIFYIDDEIILLNVEIKTAAGKRDRSGYIDSQHHFSFTEDMAYDLFLKVISL
jgi:hypothetical protein